MMQDNFMRAFRLQHRYTNPIERRRAIGILYLLGAGLLAWIGWLMFFGLPFMLDGQTVTANSVVLMLSPLSMLVVYVSVQTGRLALGSLIIVLSAFPVIILQLATATLASPNFVMVILPIVAAGLLLDVRAYLVVTMLVLAMVLGLAFSEFETFSELNDANVFGATLITIFVALFFLFFSGNFEDIISRNLQDLRRFDMVGRMASELPDDDERAVFRKALDLLRLGLGFHVAHIYIADSEGKLSERVRQGFRTVDIDSVQLSDPNALMVAAFTREIVRVSAQDASYARREHLLPSSAYGLAVPVIINGRLLAVIDIQDNVHPFSSVDVMVASMLAEQVGRLMHDVRIIRTLRVSLNDQQQMIGDLRERLNALRAYERDTVTSIWDSYLDQRGKNAIGFDLEVSGLVHRDDLPETMQAALEKGDLVRQLEGDEQIINVPILLRGEVLGAMSFHLPADKPVNERRIEMAQSVAQRLAIALENQRLFEQSRLQALRERKANEVGNLLLSATDLEELLGVAANSFNEVLGAIQTHIHLQPDVSDVRRETGTHPTVGRRIDSRPLKNLPRQENE